MNDFEKVTDFGNLYKALKAACRNVRWKDSTVGYEHNGLKNTYLLRKDLLSGRYKIQPYQIFMIFEPKKRQIVATRIRDRQFQHALVDEVVYDQITRSFTADNCACLRGRGVDYCLRRMKRHLGDYYRKHGCDGWVLQCDIKSYFDSIPHDVAKATVDRYIPDSRIRGYLYQIIDSYDHGLGLGSQVNQLLALAILDDLDHYLKEKLHVKYYVRYMDDFRIISHDKEFLKKCRDVIDQYMTDHGLMLNKKKTVITPLSHGFILLKWKYMLKPSGKIIMRMSRSKVLKQKKKIAKLWAMESVGEREPGTCDQSMQSFMANARRGDTYSERREVAEFYRKLTGRKYHDYVKRRGAPLETGGDCVQKSDYTEFCDGQCGVYCQYVRYCAV